MGSTDNSAIMTIDLKWNRFRIHKSTLNKMGNPQYVQFLVNPEEMFIAVLGSDRPLTGGTSNRVKLVQTSRQYTPVRFGQYDRYSRLPIQLSYERRGGCCKQSSLFLHENLKEK